MKFKKMFLFLTMFLIFSILNPFPQIPKTCENNLLFLKIDINRNYNNYEELFQFDYLKENFIQSNESICRDIFWSLSYYIVDKSELISTVRKWKNDWSITKKMCTLCIYNILRYESPIINPQIYEILSTAIEKTEDEDLYICRFAFYLILNVLDTVQIDEQSKSYLLNKIVEPALKNQDPFIRGDAIELLFTLKESNISDEEFSYIKENLENPHRYVQMSALSTLHFLSTFNQFVKPIFEIAKNYINSLNSETICDLLFLLGGIGQHDNYREKILNIAEILLENPNIEYQSYGLIICSNLIGTIIYYQQFSEKSIIDKNIIEKIEKIGDSYLKQQNLEIQEDIIFLYKSLINTNEKNTLNKALELVKTKVNDSDLLVKSTAIDLLVALTQRNLGIKLAQQVAKKCINSNEETLQILGIKLYCSLVQNGNDYKNVFKDLQKLRTRYISLQMRKNILILLKELLNEKKASQLLIQKIEEEIIFNLRYIKESYDSSELKNILPLVLDLCTHQTKNNLFIKQVIEIIDFCLGDNSPSEEIFHKTEEVIQELIEKENALYELKNLAINNFGRTELKTISASIIFIHLSKKGKFLDKITPYVRELEKYDKQIFKELTIELYCNLLAYDKEIENAINFSNKILNDISFTSKEKEIKTNLLFWLLSFYEKVVKKGLTPEEIHAFIKEASSSGNKDLETRAQKLHQKMLDNKAQIDQTEAGCLSFLKKILTFDW